MKNVILEVFDGKTQFKNNFQLHNQTGDKKVIGTSISRLFTFNGRLKKYGASHFKANQDISVVISVNDAIILDTYSLNSEYGFKLRFGNTAKSKRKFANCINDLVTWAASDIKPITIEELINELEAQ